MDLSLETVSAIVAQYEREVAQLKHSVASGLPAVLSELALKRIHADVPLLLSKLKGNSSQHDSVRRRVTHVANEVDELRFETARQVEQEAVAVVAAPQNDHVVPHETVSGEDYASLRKRLLADGASSQFDNADRDRVNAYHETFQEDIMGDLSELASSLKTSAMSLSSKIVDDLKLVSATGENMLKSLTLMQTVGRNLNGYLSEKSGGKITLFFMIKTMAFAFVLFFFTVVIAKILPKM